MPKTIMSRTKVANGVDKAKIKGEKRLKNQKVPVTKPVVTDKRK